MLLAFLLAFTASADFDWRRWSDQKAVLNGFNNLAQFCVESFGFTRIPKQSDELLRGKLEAHLLLAKSGDAEVLTWLGIMEQARAVEKAAKDESVADRAADALIAAEADPASFDRAEALWVETMMQPAKEVLAACNRAAKDKFIGRYYLTGEGSADQYIGIARRAFADRVKLIRDNRK